MSFFGMTGIVSLGTADASYFILFPYYSPWASFIFALAFFLSVLFRYSLLHSSGDMDYFLSSSSEEFANYGQESNNNNHNNNEKKYHHHLSKEHLEAIARRQWGTLLSWIAFHPNEVAALRDRKGQTVLHHAALFRAPAHVMESILWVAPELASVPNRDGELALHWAVRLSTPNQVLSLLLEANPDSAFQKDREGITPLSLLWERHQASLINVWRAEKDKLLKESENNWKRILLVFRAIHKAEENNKMSGGGDNDETTTFFPLHIAVSCPLPPGLLPLMIEVYKEELFTRDDHGMLPLAIACKCPVANQYCDVLTKIQLLLREFPDGAKYLSCGRYPLQIAAASGVLWGDGIESLIQAFPSALAICDARSGLFPVALAAARKKKGSIEEDVRLGGSLNVLTNIYSLLREDPSVLRTV